MGFGQVSRYPIIYIDTASITYTPLSEYRGNSRQTISSNDTVQIVYPEFKGEYPEFKGGISSLAAFAQRQMAYPWEAEDNGISGTVGIKFVVQADACIEDVSIVRGVDRTLDQECIRFVRLLFGKWIPGKINGMSVPCEITMKINFKLIDNR